MESDETIEGDLFLARGTLDLNGHKLTVTGNLIHSGGTVLVNGGELGFQFGQEKHNCLSQKLRETEQHSYQ